MTPEQLVAAALASRSFWVKVGEGKRVPIVVRVPSWNRNAVKEIPH
jgi:hypothetical protein